MAENLKKKYGKTISVDHFLNTQLKPTKVPFGKTFVDAYPLYVKITVKRQNTKFRSSMLEFVPLNQFDKFKKTNKKTLDSEIEYYRSVLEQAKPFENEDFNLANALKADNGDEPIDHLIEKYLRIEFVNALQQDLTSIYIKEKGILFPNFKNEDSDRISLIEKEARSKAMSIAGMVLTARTARLFANSQFPMTENLWNKYELELWLNWDYCTIIEDEEDRVPSLSDWLIGEYDRAFLRLWNDTKALHNLHLGFEKLKESHKELKDRILSLK